MGTKNLKGSVSIETINKRIRLRWRYQKKRYCLNLFSFNKQNHLRAKKIAVSIENDISNGSFDVSTNRYKPKAALEVPVVQKSLIQCFEEWVKNYRNMDCDRDIDYNSTRNMLRRWKSLELSEVVSNLGKEKFSARTYNRRLTLLQAFFTWAYKTKVIDSNPLEDVLPKKMKKTEKVNRKPFSEEEIKLVLNAIKNDTFSPVCSANKHSHYFPFVFFLFKTGARNAEAVGLRVQHVDLAANVIHIKEALARSLKGTNAAARIRKETKNGKQRVLPLTDDLRAILLPLVVAKQPDDLVFQSPTGKAIDDRMFQKRIFSKVLQCLKIQHRVLYACRHTFSSRCINSGMNPVTTSFLMGNNPETALRNYTHFTNLPNTLPTLL